MAGLNFSVKVGEPELIRPDTPTPLEFKYLSNIDDQAGLRNHIPFVHFYPARAGSTSPPDPAPVIRRAVARALVHYYPLAGRLPNGDKGKLVVKCSAEGIRFREADADVTLGELRRFEGGLRPPFPQWDRLLVDDVWGCYSVTDSPLLSMQVTRLSCGGFVLAYVFNHCACDACGALQFLNAVAELARDPSLLCPSLLPSWSRELLSHRSPPRVSYPHPEYDTVVTTNNTLLTPQEEFRRLTQLSVFFSRADIASLKAKTLRGAKTPTFDVVAACLWRSRTLALALAGETRLLFPIDTRLRHHPRLPPGYYGAAVVFPCAVVTSSALLRSPFYYATEMISDLKKAASDDEYRASTVDFIEANGRRGFCGGEGAFVVSDMSRLGFAKVDLGWGEAVYGGPARAGTGAVPGMVTSVVAHRREAGEVAEEGLLALVSMPEGAVEAFFGAVSAEIRASALTGAAAL